MGSGSENKLIEVGDTVNVYFESLEPLFEMTVLYVPCATGDAFHLSKGGHIFYVQNYSIICHSAAAIGGETWEVVKKIR